MFYQALDTGNISHGGMSFLKAAEITKKAGFDGFWFDAGRDFTADLLETKDLLAATGLKAAGFGLPLEFRKDEDSFASGISKLARRAAYARALGITRCATWIMPSHKALDYQSNFEQHRKRLSQAAQILKDEGIWLGLEFVSSFHLWKNAAHPFIHDLQGMLALCEAIGTGNCGILMDAWHWHLSGHDLADFEKFTDPKQIVLAHVMDAPSNVPDEEQIDQVRRLPGTTGVINIDAFFAGLMLAGYDGPVAVEPFEPYLAKLPFEQAVTLVKKRLDSVWPV